jgi:hypothetical protein
MAGHLEPTDRDLRRIGRELPCHRRSGLLDTAFRLQAHSGSGQIRDPGISTEVRAVFPGQLAREKTSQRVLDLASLTEVRVIADYLGEDPNRFCQRFPIGYRLGHTDMILVAADVSWRASGSEQAAVYERRPDQVEHIQQLTGFSVESMDMSGRKIHFVCDSYRPF